MSNHGCVAKCAELEPGKDKHCTFSDSQLADKREHSKDICPCGNVAKLEEIKEVSKKRIGIDCEPFRPRPDSYIGKVIEGTSLQDGVVISKQFGAWIWEFEISDEDWNKIEPTIGERIEKLYSDGCIRGGMRTKQIEIEDENIFRIRKAESSNE